MAGNQHQNRREKVRVDFRTQILLEIGEEKIHIEGNSSNLSLGGMYVNTIRDFPIGQNCKVGVLLSGGTEKTTLEMEGSVVRKEPGGIAIAFDSMDLDSYSCLRNIVRYNASDSENLDW